jgi:lysylphosphatidylglycerol synthetase-like protein (DUF2156 family)
MSAATRDRASLVLDDRDAQALDVLARRASHSSAFLAFNRDTRHYMADGIDGLVAYRPAGRRHAVQICGPFAAPGERARLMRAFCAWSAWQGRRVVAVQLRREEAREFSELGFVVNQLGSAYSIHLEDFSLRGTRFMKVRNKLARARRLGVTVQELARDASAASAHAAELDAVDAAWLRSKGRLSKELTFMIGERGGRGAALRRVFVARLSGQVIAYVTYSPCFGERSGWLYDLTRRRPTAPPGTIELIFQTALEQLKDEGEQWLHLGLTPLVGLDVEHELAGASSRPVRWFVHELSAHGEAIYPARSQEAFKCKWAPHAIEPEYVAFQEGPSLAAVWQLLRMTRAI